MGVGWWEVRLGTGRALAGPEEGWSPGGRQWLEPSLQLLLSGPLGRFLRCCEPRPSDLFSGESDQQAPASSGLLGGLDEMMPVQHLTRGAQYGQPLPLRTELEERLTEGGVSHVKTRGGEVGPG